MKKEYVFSGVSLLMLILLGWTYFAYKNVKIKYEDLLAEQDSITHHLGLHVVVSQNYPEGALILKANPEELKKFNSAVNQYQNRINGDVTLPKTLNLKRIFTQIDSSMTDEMIDSYTAPNVGIFLELNKQEDLAGSR